MPSGLALPCLVSWVPLGQLTFPLPLACALLPPGGSLDNLQCTGQGGVDGGFSPQPEDCACVQCLGVSVCAHMLMHSHFTWPKTLEMEENSERSKAAPQMEGVIIVITVITVIKIIMLA